MIMTLYRTGQNGIIYYYSLHDRQPLLTARYALTVAWRTGNGKEREKIYGFDTLADMDRKIRELFGRRMQKGYKLLYSFIRDLTDSANVPGATPPDSSLVQASAGQKH
jgi:hypothetical protein